MKSLDLAREHGGLLRGIDGVVGVMLGGSHARGVAVPGSDIDLGVYYREPLDIDAMADLASELVGRSTPVAGPGEWGPWVNGGAWLDLDGGPVDWILRDIDRVSAELARAERGEFELHTQPGHPFGFVSTAYVGECAVGIVTGDTAGELAELHERCREYPEALRAAVVGWLWEARFSLDLADKPAARGDATYVTMSVTHAVAIMCHALHAHARSWVVNEKGLIGASGALPNAPSDFTLRAHRLCAGGGTSTEELTTRLTGVRRLLDDVADAVGSSTPAPVRTAH